MTHEIPTLAPWVLALLVLVGFAAGIVDAIGGGGGLLTLPALLGVGLDPHLALGTNKGQATFGAVSSALAYWRRGGIDRERAPIGFLGGLVGAVLGALAQLAIDPKPLRPIVFGLLVGAAVLLAVRPTLTSKPRAPTSPRAVLGAIAVAMGAYDGFFGPGTGTLLILAFVLAFGDSITRASGNAKVTNLASNVASFATFAVGGTIVWKVALPMAVGNAIGAHIGARLALSKGDRFVRAVVLVVVAGLLAKVGWDFVKR
jgi:uncharacterized membrane protein YfcA